MSINILFILIISNLIGVECKTYKYRRRDLSNFRNEKNNYFVYLNLPTNKLENQTNKIASQSDQINLSQSSNEFLKQILNILFQNSDNLSTKSTKPIIDTEVHGNENDLKSTIDANLINQHFNTLFRILSFIAFVLVCFSLISLVGLVLFIMSHNFEFKSTKVNTETDTNNSNDDSASIASNLNSCHEFSDKDQLDDEQTGLNLNEFCFDSKICKEKSNHFTRYHLQK